MLINWDRGVEHGAEEESKRQVGALSISRDKTQNIYNQYKIKCGNLSFQSSVLKVPSMFVALRFRRFMSQVTIACGKTER